MDLKIWWKDGEEKKVFSVDDVLHMSRTHAINLFSGTISVMAQLWSMAVLC